jgi:hypothetical protein
MNALGYGSLFDNYRERLILGTLLLKPQRWTETEGLSIEDFGASDHREIYATMARLVEDGKGAGFDDVIAELQGKDNLIACVGDLIDVTETGSADLKNAIAKLQEFRKKRLLERSIESVRQWYCCSTTFQLVSYLSGTLETLRQWDDTPTKCGLIVDTLASVRARPQGYLWEPYLPDEPTNCPLWPEPYCQINHCTGLGCSYNHRSRLARWFT